jgi:predicted ATP-binding protein involved in virulence/nucleoside phosphorylase
MRCVVILTSLPIEYLAVREYIRNPHEQITESGTIYERGVFTSNDQSCDVIIIETGRGNSIAGLEAERAIRCFNPDIILFVGTASGIRDVAVGDVVIATKIYNYDSGVTTTDGAFSPRPITVFPSYSLEQRARSEIRKNEWVDRLSTINSNPRAFAAPVASGEKILTSDKSESFKLLNSFYHDAIAVEMEGFGFLSAIKSYSNISALVIKGISNIITENGKHYNDKIAAMNASAFAFEILDKVKFKQFPKGRKTIASFKKTNKRHSFVISKVELFNIRCFNKLDINVFNKGQSCSWTMFLGDNAIGKSTILKSIALGLCNESDAAALIKASEMQGDFIRKGATEGYIKITLCRDSKAKRPKKYIITTRITKKSEDAPEIVRQETQPAENFPWADIFVCGYGAYRSKQADTSYEQYKAIDAVKSLFDHQTSLQNPELILLRQDPQIRTILEEKLRNILMLDTDHTIHYTKRGLEIEGPWGRMPFQTLSDGYRSTTIWVLDFIGWLIHAERLLDNPDIGGILIIDEIEQHLHPRWQRYIVQRLRQQFPKTQIIASTHTPLVAAGIADVDQSMLLKLERNEENEISLKIIDKEQVAGKRADQVLTSDAFGLYTTRNERSHDDVDRYTKLLGKKIRNEAEEAELEELRSQVSSRFSTGETHFEQLVEKAVDEVLKNMDTPVSPEMLNLETKKQLQSLFHPED